MNITGDKNYFDAEYRYYDALTDTHEEFRDIKGFIGKNQVSNFGRVLSLKTPRNSFKDKILKPMNNMGYLAVDLRGKQYSKSRKIHRLVAEAFLSNPKNLPDTNHKDTDKTNNFFKNLEWSSTSDNVQHSWDNNLQNRPIGILSARSKFSEQQVFSIIDKLNNGMNCVKIANDYGVNPRTIYRIKWGESYSNLSHLIKL